MYSKIKKIIVPKMTVATYTIISPNPEEDVIARMKDWLKASQDQLAAFNSIGIGWDFPFLNSQQKEEFNLRGYTYGFSVPSDFKPSNDGVKIVDINEDEYITLRISDPFSDPKQTIPTGWSLLREYAQKHDIETLNWDNRYAFEHVSIVDGKQVMDIFLPIN